MIAPAAYVQSLLGRAYTPDFRCWDLVKQVERDLFGRAVPSIASDIETPRQILRTFECHPERARWRLSDNPSSGSIVLMGGARREHHAGVYLDIDRCGVLHTLPDHGVIYEPWRDILARCGIVNIYQFIGP